MVWYIFLFSLPCQYSCLALVFPLVFFLSPFAVKFITKFIDFLLSSKKNHWEKKNSVGVCEHFHSRLESRASNIQLLSINDMMSWTCSFNMEERRKVGRVHDICMIHTFTLFFTLYRFSLLANCFLWIIKDVKSCEEGKLRS